MRVAGENPVRRDNARVVESTDTGDLKSPDRLDRAGLSPALGILVITLYGGAADCKSAMLTHTEGSTPSITSI